MLINILRLIQNEIPNSNPDDQDLPPCQGAADGRVNLLGEAVPLESEEEIAEAKKFLGFKK